MPQVAPSLLAADFLNLNRSVDIVNNNADIFHLDIMDGTLVPNISFGFSVVEAVAPVAKKPMDVHLMIIHPEKYIEKFAKTGASMISFHLEACDRDNLNPDEIIDQIKGYGVKAGLVINPDIPVERLFPYLAKVDYILLMSVFAGFGGQKFIPETLERIKAVKAEAKRQGVDCCVEIDGGVTVSNAASIAEAGADILVAGSAVFKSENPSEVVSILRG